MNQDNIGKLMQQAKRMQEEMQRAQKELEEKIEMGEAGGVVIEMNGRHDVRKVTIKPSLMEEDIEMLEDLIAAAFNDAVRKIEKFSKEKISQLTAGLNIPTDLLGDKEE